MVANTLGFSKTASSLSGAMNVETSNNIQSTFVSDINLQDNEERTLNFVFSDILPPTHLTQDIPQKPSSSLYDVQLLDDMVSRPINMGNYELKNFLQLNPMREVYRANTFFSSIINNFALVRFDITLDFIVRTNKLYYGEYVIAWIPYPNYFYRDWHNDIYQIVQFPHVSIDLSLSKRYSLTIPYFGQYEYIPTNSPDFLAYGLITGMKIVSGPYMTNPRTPTVTVYARLHNVQFACPLGRPLVKVSDITADVGWKAPEAAIVEEEKVPASNNASTFTKAWAAKPTGKLGAYIDMASGFSNEPVTLKKTVITLSGYFIKHTNYTLNCVRQKPFNIPIRLAAQMLSAIATAGSIVSTSRNVLESAVTAVKQVGTRVGWIAEAATKINLLPSENVPTMKDSTTAGTPHTGLSSRIKEFQLIWANSLVGNVGEVVVCIPVSPTTTAKFKTAYIASHPLMWMSRMFKRWRGSLIFRFRVYGNVFMAAQFKAFWSPTPGTKRYGSPYIPQITVDCTQATEFTITVPYYSMKRYLAVGAPNGYLTLIRESPTTNNPSLDLNTEFVCTISMAAGPDFEFTSPGITSLILKTPLDSHRHKRATTFEVPSSLIGTGISFGLGVNSRVDYVLSGDGTVYQVIKEKMQSMHLLLPGGWAVVEINQYNPRLRTFSPLKLDIIELDDKANLLVYVQYDLAGSSGLMKWKVKDTAHYSYVHNTSSFTAVPIWDGNRPTEHNFITGEPVWDLRFPPTTAGEIISYIRDDDYGRFWAASFYKSDLGHFISPVSTWKPTVQPYTNSIIYKRDIYSPFTWTAYALSFTSMADIGTARVNNSAREGSDWSPIDWNTRTSNEGLPLISDYPPKSFMELDSEGNMIVFVDGHEFARFIWTGVKWMIQGYVSLARVFPITTAQSAVLAKFKWVDKLQRHVYAFNDADLDMVTNQLYIYPSGSRNPGDTWYSRTPADTITIIPSGPYDTTGSIYMSLPGYCCALIFSTTSTNLEAEFQAIPDPGAGVGTDATATRPDSPPTFPLPERAFGWYDTTGPPVPELTFGYTYILDGRPYCKWDISAGVWRLLFEAQMGVEQIDSGPIGVKDEPVISEEIMPVESQISPKLDDAPSFFDDSFVVKMASFLGSKKADRLFINPLGPISQTVEPLPYINWVRLCYLMSKGSVVVKALAKAPVMISLLPFSAPLRIKSAIISLNPPQDVFVNLGLSMLKALASTASVTQDPTSTPLEVVVPYLSDCVAIFNILDDIVVDSNYTALMVQGVGTTNQEIEFYMGAGSDFTLHWPIPPPPIIADIWSSFSRADQAKYIEGETSGSWWDWLRGLFSDPVSTVTRTIQSGVSYLMISLGVYNNYAIPGTVASLSDDFYY